MLFDYVRLKKLRLAQNSIDVVQLYSPTSDGFGTRNQIVSKDATPDTGITPTKVVNIIDTQISKYKIRTKLKLTQTW